MIAENDLVQIALTIAVVWVTVSNFVRQVSGSKRLDALGSVDSRGDVSALPDDPLEAEFLELEAAVAERRAARSVAGDEIVA